jgi:hypothetical protein
MPFTLQGYRDLVTHLRHEGYSVVGYETIEADKRHLILRHDVDFCLKSALELARAENALGLAAVYFVQMRSEFYNPLTKTSQESLRKLRELGHEIGLHFDPRDGVTKNALEDLIASDAAGLSEASQGRVDAVSFHRPPQEHLAGDERLGGLWNAYAGRFIRDVGYCSDSRGGWRHGDPLSHNAVRSGRALQLLTHPIWWTGEAGSPELRLQQFLASRLRDVDQEIAANCEIHRPGLVNVTFR